MLDGLAAIDGWAIASILTKAADYTFALTAMGGPLFVAVFRSAPDDVLAVARRYAVIAALVGLGILALRFGILAARISGAGLSGAMDPVMLGLAWDSPLGTATMWRVGGMLAILAMGVGGATGLLAGLFGALVMAWSFTFVGHSLGDPAWLLGGLLATHLLAVAFWIAALPPLYHCVDQVGGAALLKRFGKVASGTVAVLIVVGACFAGLLTGSFGALFTTAYGWTLMVKLGAVALLLKLAANNKLRLVADLAMGAPGAVDRLRRSIRLEIVAFAVILLATATLTSITTPPVNL